MDQASPDGAGGRRTAPTGRTKPTAALLAVVGGVVLVTAVTGIVLVTRDSDPTPHREARGTLEWSDCSRLECATVSVPLDHDDPDGRRIDLAVARMPASGDPDGHLGTLVLHPGGPGASGLDILASASHIGDLEGLNERFDLVAWDPRGVGGSTRLDCDAATADRFRSTDPIPDDEEELAALHRAAEDLAESCAAADTELASKLGTDQTVEDIEAIRVGLGEEQISWFGFSYGTHVGLAYSQAHPDRVRAMVLDGALDPERGVLGMLTDQAVAFEGFLDETLPPGLYERAEQRLEADSSIPGNESGPADLVVGSVMAVYSPFRAAELADVLDAVVRGDTADLAAEAATYRSSGDFSAYVGTLCADGDFPRSASGALALAEETASVAPRVGAAVVNELLPCTWWPETDPVDPRPPSGDRLPPVLVVGTTGDVATPLAHAEAVAAALPGAGLVVRVGGGHTGYGASSCVQEIVATYLVDVAVSGDLTTCQL